MDLSPIGDLPPNHPLVLEALKGIISGPISELRSTVDANITESTTQAGLKKGQIDYQRILPIQNSTQQSRNDDYSRNIDISNEILNNIAPVQYYSSSGSASPQIQEDKSDYDPNQMELPLFKQTDVSDLYKKLSDIERKLDIVLNHVKNNKNQK